MKDFEKLDSSFSNLFLQGKEAFFFFFGFKNFCSVRNESVFALCVYGFGTI